MDPFVGSGTACAHTHTRNTLARKYMRDARASCCFIRAATCCAQKLYVLHLFARAQPGAAKIESAFIKHGVSRDT